MELPSLVKSVMSLERSIMVCEGNRMCVHMVSGDLDKQK